VLVSSGTALSAARVAHAEFSHFGDCATNSAGSGWRMAMREIIVKLTVDGKAYDNRSRSYGFASSSDVDLGNNLRWKSDRRG